MKLKTLIGSASLLVIMVLALNSCALDQKYTPQIAVVLELAGENAIELERVIVHYRQSGDSLKFEAAKFLIGNMAEHSYVKYRLFDTSGATVELDPLSFENYGQLTDWADSVEQVRGEIDYEKTETILDVHTVKSDFLIEQIDLAFRSWRERPWAKHLNFDQFCQYVLPHRGSNEPLESWRPYFWAKYDTLEQAMADETDPLEAASLINSDIRTWFGFDERYYFHPTDQGLSEMVDSKLGRCEDMTNITIFALRANGLPVTSDYTPYWANSGNNHAWNAILNKDGKVIPFMGAEANPGEYTLSGKAAKVYRKTYAEQKDNLVFQPHKQESIPRWLNRRNYSDVTVDYVITSDISVSFEKSVPDSVDIAYLCVFNSGHWKAIDWGRITDSTGFFTDMGTDVAYLPALYLNKEIVPFGVPFVEHGDFTRQEFPVDTSKTFNVWLTSTTKRKLVKSTDGITVSHLERGKVYELFYWQDGWQSLGKKAAGKRPIRFNDVPLGALYWLVEEGSNREERIFTISDDGLQVWW